MTTGAIISEWHHQQEYDGEIVTGAAHHIGAHRAHHAANAFIYHRRRRNIASSYIMAAKCRPA